MCSWFFLGWPVSVAIGDSTWQELSLSAKNVEALQATGDSPGVQKDVAKVWKGDMFFTILMACLDVSTFFKITTAWSSEVYKWVCSHYFSFMIYIMLCSHMSEYSSGSTFSKSKRHHNHLLTNDKLLTETMPKWFHFRCWSLRLWSFPLECGCLGSKTPAAFDHPKTVSKTQAEAKLEMEDEVRIEEGPLGLRTRTTVGSLMFIKTIWLFWLTQHHTLNWLQQASQLRGCVGWFDPFILAGPRQIWAILVQLKIARFWFSVCSLEDSWTWVDWRVYRIYPFKNSPWIIDYWWISPWPNHQRPPELWLARNRLARLEGEEFSHHLQGGTTAMCFASPCWRPLRWSQTN